MRKLIYSMGVSLDGFIAGREGEIDWTAPDDELMRFHNEQTRGASTRICAAGGCMRTCCRGRRRRRGAT